MAEQTDASTPRRRGRPRGGQDNKRGRIEAAAREEFAELGYAAGSMRAIARRAGVDPALVRHYFTDKAELFAAAVRLPVRPDLILGPLVDGPVESLGERLITGLVTAWDDPDIRARAIPLFRSILGEDGLGATVPEFIVGELLGRVADVLDSADATERASLVASQMVGIIAARYLVGLEPLASLPAERVVEMVAPTLQRYLTGDLPGA